MSATIENIVSVVFVPAHSVAPPPTGLEWHVPVINGTYREARLFGFKRVNLGNPKINGTLVIKVTQEHAAWGGSEADNKGFQIAAEQEFSWNQRKVFFAVQKAQGL